MIVLIPVKGCTIVAAEAAASAKPVATWYDVVSRLNALDLAEERATVILGELRRVFGDRNGSGQSALDWLRQASGPCGGKPVDLLAGKVPGVPIERAEARILAYLRSAPDAPPPP